MIIEFEFPDSLFVETTLITGLKRDGNKITLVGEPYESFASFDRSIWQIGDFGFITSDASGETPFDRLLLISKVVEFARSRLPCNFEFLFNIWKGKTSSSLSVAYREKKDW